MAWAPLYADKDDLKGHLKITGVSSDTELTRAVTAAARAIDRYTSRQFGRVDASETRTYDTVWDRKIGAYVAEVDDIAIAAGLVVTVDGATVAAADLRLEPRNNDKIGRPFEFIVTRSATTPTLGGGPCTIDVTTDQFGWTAVPVEVEEATILEAAKLHFRRDAPQGVAGSPDIGSELRMLAMVDPDARNLVEDLKRDTSFA